MTTNASKVTLHMVSSLDGFIAKPDGSVSWMQSTDNYEKGVTLTKEKIAEFLESIDCYVMVPDIRTRSRTWMALW